MSEPYYYYEYLSVDGAELFTAVCLPAPTGKFPTVIFRSPYVELFADVDGGCVAERLRYDQHRWVDAGYAVILQHCRGRGKSTGDCVPYIYEREDGLFLQEWVRKQSFYNGEIVLVGESYTASAHLVTAPFGDDIKGAIIHVQDCNRYNCNYRNGFYKSGLHGEWYTNLYKSKKIPKKNYTSESFNMLPLINYSKEVFKESAEDFDGVLLHPDKNDDFWNTRLGGGEAKDAIKNARIPILLVTGFYDIFTGGIFDMWKGLDIPTKEKCAMLVHPNDHSNDWNAQPIKFERGNIWDEFADYDLRWAAYARGLCDAPVTTGKVTYYKLFGCEWRTDDFLPEEKSLSFTLGEGELTYIYDPSDPASFKGGLSTNFGGVAWQDPPGIREDILTFYTPEFEEDTFIKGQMRAKLRVRSDCEDTCFYVRLSLETEKGSYGLRDDINQISNFAPDYVPGDMVDMDFTFDEHAFVVHKGERLRIDVSSSAYPLYVRHTNNRGLYSLQETAKKAKNTVVCNKSSITVYTV